MTQKRDILHLLSLLHHQDKVFECNVITTKDLAF